MKKLLILGISLVFLVSCGNNETDKKEGLIAVGQKVFDENCVYCHGKAGKGLAKDWRKPLKNGKYPAPPLNGTAHTWHHSPKVLLNSINNGGKKFGGWMTPFKDKLTQKEKTAILAYLHSLWPKEIQQKYDRRFK
jgi:mono/diheme cytochrome c family protein